METPIAINTEKLVRSMKGAGSPAVKRMKKTRASKLPTDKIADVRVLDEAMKATDDAATFDGEEGERRRSDGMDAAAVSRKHVLRLARHACVVAASMRVDRTATADDAQKWLIDQGYSSDYLGNAAGSLFTDKNTWEFTGQWLTSQRVSNHGHKNRVWRLK
jgi:hypothetical protein